MFSVDNNGQYPGSTVTGVATTAPTAPEQPYLANVPSCPVAPVAAGAATNYSGFVSLSPPGFVVQCEVGTALHEAAGLTAGYPQFASDVGGVRDSGANQTNVPNSGPALAINLLHY